MISTSLKRRKQKQKIIERLRYFAERRKVNKLTLLYWPVFISFFHPLGLSPHTYKHTRKLLALLKKTKRHTYTHL